MGAMVSDFPSLPKDEEEDRAKSYAAVYTEFKARNVPLPQEDPKRVKRATLLALLQAVGGALIKAELAADETRPVSMARDDGQSHPNGTLLRQYADKTDEQIAEHFNQFRAGVVFVGLPFAPNVVTPEDITAAKV